MRGTNDEHEDEDEDVWKPQPTSNPGTSVDRECSDTHPRFCGLLKHMGVLYCDYDYIKKACCASCTAAIRREPDSADVSQDEH
ncbi:hypothetical protein KIN20_000312 [Parelaphostrongylus tenuis]|uniref:PLAC domain-containing protein n=1 Tax=Parelaphostrongylus tenuis TaxID=148309 RepID=A0AAD5QBE9_PARTN|nr:hypothetical protein KIN20_000312 [Parelaphostrongylus tenuis]